MIKLGFAIYDISVSAYNLYHATSHQQKLQNMETLLLGAFKAATVAAVCLSLYIARFVIQTSHLQYALAGLTFCVHPLATLDVVGTICCINGLFHIVVAYIPHRKIAAELRKWEQAASEQVRNEGFKFYSFWERCLWGDFPPETNRRISEVYKEIAAKYDFSQIRTWGVPMAKDFTEGITLMKYASICGIGALIANAVPASFWLDRKCDDLSKWLAQRLI